MIAQRVLHADARGREKSHARGFRIGQRIGGLRRHGADIETHHADAGIEVGKPDITGQYTVYASFTGSESYWPSHAVTAFSVDPAAPTPAPTNTQPQFDSVTQSLQNTIIIAAVAIIIAIAIVGILTLRKRP